MEKGSNIEGFFPFIMIILVFVISNLKKKMAEKEKQKKREQTPARLEPVYRSPLPSIKTAEVPTIKQEEVSQPSPPETKVVFRKKTRIQKIVGRLHSKKDLVVIAEILNQRCF